MARKAQLEDLAVDNQQFDCKRREVEAWLARMEAWHSRMRPVASSPDVLEAQIREQKVGPRPNNIAECDALRHYESSTSCRILIRSSQV